MKDLLKSKSLLFSMLGIVILIVGIVVALQLIPQEQDVREQAAVPGGVAKIRVSPATITLATGETKKATVSFNTSNETAVNISVSMKLNYTGENPPVTAKNIIIDPSLIEDGWSCNPKKVDIGSGVMNIQVSCINANGINSGQAFRNLFTFDLEAGNTPTSQPLTIAFDPADTTISKKQAAGADVPSDIVDIPSNLSVTITGGSTPTPAPSSSPTPAPSATPNPTSTPTPTTTPVPSPTATPSTSTKRLLLSTDGLQCGGSDFTIRATAKDGTTNANGVDVTFKYNGETKNDMTDSNGVAEVKFNRTSTNKELTAEAGAYESSTITVNLPSNCSSSGTTSSVSCNQNCDSSRTCASGLTCINGACRDNRCPSDTSCGCEDVDVASENGTTNLPQSGFDQTLAMTVLGLLFLLGGAQLFWSFRLNATKSEE